ncbi:MAG: acetate--CoA ligase family protein [Thaumarchaeota archaeon]|nr:acetate--CoA ligase family protein [Nitrososphaerota archaeon]
MQDGAAMQQVDLSPFFQAKTVAVIGASESGASAAVFNNLKSMGFSLDNLYLVNPKRDNVFGHLCYNNVSSLPISPDVAFIATRSQIAISSVKECADRGIRAGIIFAEGFTESGEEGRALQQKLKETALENNFLLCGPNCMGLVVPSRQLGLWALNLPGRMRQGNIGAVFQSSGILNLFYDLITTRGLGFSVAVSVGNEATLETSEYLRYVVADPNTSIVIMYLEGVRNPAGLSDALDLARSAKKQVVAIRAGKSELARQNMVAHTGKLVSSGSALDSWLKQKGVILVNNYDELLETAVLFSALGTPEEELSDAIGLISNSGGDVTYLSDLSERLHVKLAELSPTVRAQLSQKLEKPTMVGNPLDISDYHPNFYDCLDAYLGDPSFDVVGCRLILPHKPTDALKSEYTRVSTFARNHGKTIVFLSRASEFFDAEWYDFFSKNGTPFLEEYEKALKAISSYIGASHERKAVAKAGESRHPQSTIIEKAISLSPEGVLQYQTIQGLAIAYGIPTPSSTLAESPEMASQAATRIGFPVALKVVSRQLIHKTEAGGVALGIKTTSEVEETFRRIVGEAKRSNPEAIIDGVLVQQMVEGGVAEALIGTSRDPQLGPIVVFGLGGVFVEVLKDIATRVPPFELAVAYGMIDELRGKKILLGFRGKPRADLDALAATIWKVSQLALDFKDTISEFEINPLVVFPEGKGVSAIDIRAVRPQR